jgi:hypothetical protein
MDGKMNRFEMLNEEESSEVKSSEVVPKVNGGDPSEVEKVSKAPIEPLKGFSRELLYDLVYMHGIDVDVEFEIERLRKYETNPIF